MSSIGRIDCHVHYLPSVFGDQLGKHRAGRGSLQDVVASRPGWRDLNVHSDLMNRSNVDVGVIIEPGSLLDGLRRLGGSIEIPS